MQETYNLQAIVLNRRPFREADVCVTLYSRERGRLDLIARGAKKSTSKLASHIEPLNLINAMAIRGKQFDYLGSAINADSFLEIKYDLEKIALSGRAIKLFSKLIGEDLPDEELFAFLFNFLSIISQNKAENYELTYYAFVLKLLKILGQAPNLATCNQCGKDLLAENIYFDTRKVELICQDCKNKNASDYINISQETWQTLNFLLEKNLTEVLKIKNNKKINQEVEGIVLFLIT